MSWFLYVIECRDGSLYTGISTDVARRYAQHLAGKGARYTRARPPERLLLTVEFVSRSEALKAEYAVKQMRVEEKRAWCARHADEANGRCERVAGAVGDILSPESGDPDDLVKTELIE